MDEGMTDIEGSETSTVGERLRAAREDKGLSLEDIASQTRIPRRHLESIEAGDWDRLPAPTYTIGFAKSFAGAVGLDRNEVGDEIRAEIGGQRSDSTTAEVFQPADPARTMPRWLVLGALGAVVLLVLLLSWINSESLESPEPAAVEATTNAAAPPAAATPPPPPPPVTNAPVMIVAQEPVWIQVSERGGRTLFQGELGIGQRYQVPLTATAPVLRTGKPEALRIMIGQQAVPPVGPPATTISDVSLLGPDLMRGGRPVSATPPPARQPITNP